MKRYPDAVVDGNKLRVMKKRCDQCLVTDARIVSEARYHNILEECQRTNRYFICHKSVEPTVCRGFFETGINALCRYAGAVGALVEVEPPR